MFKKLKNKKGFTLIELIVVIAIIGILAAILLPRFTGFSKSAKEKSALSDARNYAVAVQALLAEGKTFDGDSDSDAENLVINYIGKAFPGGTLTILNEDGDFTYEKDDITITFEADSGEIAVSP